MKHSEVRLYWDGNAAVWTRLARAGYDIYRDHLNTPAFFQMLPPVAGLRGLDLGCGEGYNTRLLAQRGSRITGLDVAAGFCELARELEAQAPEGVDYLVASAVQLPFANGSFGFATAFMSLMDIPETGAILEEAYRALKPGGFLQFSITHPCYDTPHRRNLRDADGTTYALEVGDYFRNLEGDVVEWLFSAAPQQVTAGLEPFRVPRFTRTLSQWLNLVLDAGFVLERIAEPRPSDEVVGKWRGLQDAQVVAYFLHVLARKPTGRPG